ncbi:PIN domain-like protein [Piromyces finnis]|uniref:PIN domain-like protein n=1 Tax=Piromyces finnis TaxID=1754191 RepID=A0A1Y1V6P3_9FUNG|nr:PIN domain-like protein [Piromyces finnis]|eukprot:ORX48432.1 PIN domain-like protein [Piromyces finnis]
MGVRGLNKYITTNIRPSYKFWKLDRKLFKCLDCKDSQIFKFPINASKNDSVNLVIDGYSFYYFIADKFNWFPYESLNLIELSQKYLNFLLSIENLEKIIFVFDGANINIKNQTEKERRELKIISIKDFYNEIVSKEFQEKNFPKSITPSPLSFMTFMQFLLGAQKIYHCIELKFALLEADKYIAELANKYNGYVLSNDSDFFIYKTPGYINFNSLEFPKEINENINDEYNFIIKYQLYTNKEIFLNLKLTYDMLPIFASLCGNDYFKIDNYPRLKQHFKNYRNVRKNTNSIQYPIYKHIVNFILDNATQTKRPRNQTFTSRYTDLTDTQKLIIENIFTNWSSTDDFKLTLINSVRQYYLSSTNEYNTDIFEDINGNSKVLSLDKNILSSYNSGCLYPEIMNGKYN